MTKSQRSFFTFQGQNIYFMPVKGTYWIAVKPICSALDVNYNRQFKNLKQNDFFGQLQSVQPVIAADGRIRNMICLPERYIYGWLLSIRSNRVSFCTYKRQCYDALYNHFHGTINERINSLKTKTQAEREVERLERELLETQAYKDLQAARQIVKSVKRNIVRLDSSESTLFA